MQNRNALGKFFFGLSCIFMGLALSGVNYCQEDYSIMENVRIGDDSTPTPTEEPTETPDPDAPTATPTEEVEATETPDADATATSAPTAAAEALPLAGIFRSLQEMQEQPAEQAAARGSLRDGNWLGKVGSDRAAREYVDSDLDGFADWFELDRGTDPNNASSMPRLKGLSRYSARVHPQDSDLDALTNDSEIRLGTQARNFDTDQDSFSDGAEVLSGSDPLDAASVPQDSDLDGLSDQYEASVGSRRDMPDSDSDRLRDEVELALGSDLNAPDTDADGISDGKEFELGSDPLVKD